MRHAMVHAFSEHLVGMDEAFEEAINKACQPEIVQALLDEAAKTYFRQALDEEVKAYLLYGEGRKLVKKQVQNRMDADFSIP